MSAQKLQCMYRLYTNWSWLSIWILTGVSNKYLWEDLNPVNPATHCQPGISQIQLLVSRKTGASLLPEAYQIGNANLQLALDIFVFSTH